MITNEKRGRKVPWGLRYFGVMVLGMLLGSGTSIQAQLQKNALDQATLLSEESEERFLRSEQERKEFEHQKDSERLRIPSYNYHLASAVAEFQRHISDLHHRHTSCKLCRDHVKKIKSLTKKIDYAMK